MNELLWLMLGGLIEEIEEEDLHDEIDSGDEGL
jgi:hypothetical protein